MKRFFILTVIMILLFVLIFLFKGENIFFIGLRPLQRFLYCPSGQASTRDNLCLSDNKLEMCQAENDLLKKTLNFLRQSKDNFILANVIGKRSESGIEWFLLDRGESCGVKIGLAVVDEGGVLIGTIAKVDDSISHLKPIFNSGSLISGDIIHNNEIISGIVQGEYKLTIKMRYIPTDRQIDVGDTVVTSGLEEHIRRGIVIGQVAEINKKSQSIFQEIIVNPLFNPDFRVVSIILP